MRTVPAEVHFGMFCEPGLAVNANVMSASHAASEVVEDDRSGSREAELHVLVDVTRRRIAALETQSAPSAGDRLGYYLIEAVYAVILVVTIGAWAVLGFVVWVPLLVRTTTLFAATVFYVSLFRDRARLASAQRCLHFAVRFYERGFAHFRAFYRQRGEPETPAGLFEPLTALTRSEVLLVCLWVVTVWTLSAFSVKAAASALLGA
ncbi:MAG TPA: hypothetical protein VMZ90_12120 [Vicinamibacterales bacterium]|nr:hypothetical protein [Vicinamibacterales bacterium]